MSNTLEFISSLMYESIIHLEACSSDKWLQLTQQLVIRLTFLQRNLGRRRFNANIIYDYKVF